MMSKLTCDTEILDNIIAEVSKGDRSARIGFFEDSGKHPRSGATAYEIASVNNNGSTEANIPARPFVTDGANEVIQQTEADLRRGIRWLHRERIPKALQSALLEAAATQKMQILQVLEEGPYRYVANDESTVARKGFNAPLYETDWLASQIDIKYD